MRTRKCVMVALLVGGILGGAAIATGGVPAVVLTNLGQVAEVSISGLAPVLRLLTTDGATSVGPGLQFDVPLTAIRQITLDFPRIVVETATRTLVAPYSSFTGIAEALQLDRPGEPTLSIPVSSLRAIALHGSALHPVPRVWLGDGFLSMPEIAAASALVADECDDCAITAPWLDTDADLTPIWNELTPEYVPEEPEGLPWWVGLLGVAALIAAAILLAAAEPAS